MFWSQFFSFSEQSKPTKTLLQEYLCQLWTIHKVMCFASRKGKHKRSYAKAINNNLIDSKDIANPLSTNPVVRKIWDT